MRSIWIPESDAIAYIAGVVGDARQEYLEAARTGALEIRGRRTLMSLIRSLIPREDWFRAECRPGFTSSGVASPGTIARFVGPTSNYSGRDPPISSSSLAGVPRSVLRSIETRDPRPSPTAGSHRRANPEGLRRHG
jgi:hypothetical protein